MDWRKTLLSKVRVLRAIKRQMKRKIVLFSVVSIEFTVLGMILGLVILWGVWLIGLVF